MVSIAGCPAPCRQPAVSDYGSRLPVPRAASPRCPRTTGTRSPAIVRLLAEPLPAENPGHLQTAFLLFQNRCNLFRCVMILPARFSPPFATPARKTLSRDTKAPGVRSVRLHGNSPICGFPVSGNGSFGSVLGSNQFAGCAMSSASCSAARPSTSSSAGIQSLFSGLRASPGSASLVADGYFSGTIRAPPGGNARSR